MFLQTNMTKKETEKTTQLQIGRKSKNFFYGKVKMTW